MTYDAENRQTTLTDNGAGTAYTYDGDGKRVTKTSGGVTTVFVYDAQGELAAEYGPQSAGGGAAACQTCYLSWDHLGSTRMVTDQAGNIVARHDFMPFGEEIVSGFAGRPGLWGDPDGVNQKFTGKERDSESGLYYFGARYYGSALGRFTSADPENAGSDPGDPQSWNGYAYGRNNPLLYTDPTGRNYTVCDQQGQNCADLTDKQGPIFETRTALDNKAVASSTSRTRTGAIRTLAQPVTTTKRTFKALISSIIRLRRSLTA